jgi:hypothetical protein
MRRFYATAATLSLSSRATCTLEERQFAPRLSLGSCLSERGAVVDRAASNHVEAGASQLKKAVSPSSFLENGHHNGAPPSSLTNKCFSARNLAPEDPLDCCAAAEAPEPAFRALSQPCRHCRREQGVYLSNDNGTRGAATTHWDGHRGYPSGACDQASTARMAYVPWRSVKGFNAKTSDGALREDVNSSVFAAFRG